MSIKITTGAILDILFFEKRYRLFKILVIVAISIAFAWYFTRDVNEMQQLVSSEKLLISGTQDGVTYASNVEYNYALLPDKYFKIPKKSPCKGSSPNNFTTWCDEWSNPQSY